MSRHVERINRLRHSLHKEQLDALLVTDAANVTYLSGFTGDSSWLLVGRDHVWLVTDGRYTEQAAAEAPHCEVVRRKDSLVAAVAELCPTAAVRTLGFSPDELTYGAYTKLVESLEGVEAVARKDLVENLRAVKDDEEIEAIRRAVRAADEAFMRIRGRLSPGGTEREVANALEFEMRGLGARKSSFELIVAARQRSSLPHAYATDAEIAPGDPVLIDWGAQVGTYCSDATRVLFLGAPSAQWREVYSAVLKAQRVAIEALSPGVPTKEVDAVARRAIAEAGYGERFAHGLGHGVGLKVHEKPALGEKAEDTLAEGMVVTIEPGIYIPGWGGVRLEDLVVVRRDGPEVLTSVPKSLEEAILT